MMRKSVLMYGTLVLLFMSTYTMTYTTWFLLRKTAVRIISTIKLDYISPYPNCIYYKDSVHCKKIILQSLFIIIFTSLSRLLNMFYKYVWGTKQGQKNPNTFVEAIFPIACHAICLYVNKVSLLVRDWLVLPK